MSRSTIYQQAEHGNMSANKQPDGLGPWIFLDLHFIFVFFAALFLPLPMVHLLLSGHAFIGASGLLAWLAGAFITVRFFRRRHYGSAALCMAAICGLALIVYKLVP
jgi:hypothetical protein